MQKSGKAKSQRIAGPLVAPSALGTFASSFFSHRGFWSGSRKVRRGVAKISSFLPPMPLFFRGFRCEVPGISQRLRDFDTAKDVVGSS